MLLLLLTAVVLATPATATNATTPRTNATWPEWWPEGRNRLIDARVGRWHILVPPSATTTVGNKTMWSMCNAAGTPGKHFRDCEAGCNSLGGTLVSVDQAETSENDQSIEHTAKKVFALFDGDGSGSVAHSEFTEGLRRFGISMTEEEMTILVEELDHDRDGSISLQEFTHLLKSVHEREHDVAQLH